MAEADWASYLQNEQVRQAANDHATQQYNAAIASGQSEDRAQKAAEFAWKKTYEEAGLTGYYQGAPTMGTQQWWATTFGNWATPTAGQETLASQLQTGNMLGTYQGQQTQAAQQQAFNQAQALAAMYGTAYTPGGAGPAAGTQTQAAQQQAFTQGLQTQQEQRAAQAQQQAQTQEYLQLLASLRGPQNYFQYQNVLGSTPQGMRDLYAAAMGQYVPGGGATTGVNPQAASLQGLMGDISGNPYYGQGGGQLNTPNVYGQNSQGMYQQQPNVAAFTPGAQPTAQFTAQSGTNQQVNALGNGTNMYGGQQNQMNLPAPNQIAAQSWNNLAPSQKSLLTSAYEASGWNKDDVEALLNQSLPKYASNATTAGTWRLGS